MRVVVVVDAVLSATAAPAAIATGWGAAAPDDELVTVAPGSAELGTALDRAGVALVAVPTFDWSVLRESLVTAVAGAALQRGVPCVVLAGTVSVGRREAGAIGVDTAYALDAVGPGPDLAEHPDALATLVTGVARRWSRRSPISGA